MRHLYAVMAVLCLFLNVRCTDFENQTDKPMPGDVANVTSESLAQYLNIQVQPTSTPEKYMVYFSWPLIEGDKKIRIRKEQVLSVVPPAQTTFSHEVEHDQTITYTFEVFNSAAIVEKTFSKLVKIPRDFVVRAGQSEFSEDQKLNVKRVFLNPEVPLRTNGYNIEIITDEIITNKGLIETFPEGSKTAANLDGMNAGELLIKAKSATGQLKIVMRGQHGGDGSKGEPYASRAGDGQPPTEGLLICECHRCQTIINRSVQALSDIQPMRPCLCERVGRNGTDGLPGAKGRQGQRAGNGGGSGTLKVEIVDGSAFLLQTDSKVGSPGVPGEGGDGQSGGIALGKKVHCSGKVGSNGGSGQKGDAGPNGYEGEKGLICIYIATEGKNDCF